MLRAEDKLIVALDVERLEDARRIVDRLKGVVRYYKIGSQFFTAYGPEAIRVIRQKGASIFLDLKFYDIANTVSGAASSATGLGHDVALAQASAPSAAVFMMTVHTAGGLNMLQAALKGAQTKASSLGVARPYIIGVTVLTSEPTASSVVLERALLAKQAGLDGVVCSALEAREVKRSCGSNFIVVTPGIRPKDSPADDQKRTATAQEALEAGADFLVIGRPIVQAPDPLEAVKKILG